MTDPELVARLRAMSATYPTWMDRADAIGVVKFRDLLKRAALVRSQRPAYERGALADRWRRSATTVIELMANLESDVRADRRLAVEA